MKNMDRESIMKMEPGREMDELVRQYVTHYISPSNAMNQDGTFGHLPPYSTDIAAAWEVMEKIRESGGMQLGCYKEEFEFEVILVRDEFETTIYGKTAPEVICKAALYLALEDKSHD